MAVENGFGVCSRGAASQAQAARSSAGTAVGNACGAFSRVSASQTHTILEKRGGRCRRRVAALLLSECGGCITA